MTVRVLSEHDVYRLLPVADCIQPMRQVLAALAREELLQPAPVRDPAPGGGDADGADAGSPARPRRRCTR